MDRSAFKEQYLERLNAKLDAIDQANLIQAERDGLSPDRILFLKAIMGVRSTSQGSHRHGQPVSTQAGGNPLSGKGTDQT